VNCLIFKGFLCRLPRGVSSSQKQDIVKLTPAYFIGIFLSNSVYNKPLTQYRYSCHKRQSFTSDEIIDQDFKDSCRLCNFFFWPSYSKILEYLISKSRGAIRRSSLRTVTNLSVSIKADLLRIKVSLLVR